MIVCVDSLASGQAHNSSSKWVYHCHTYMAKMYLDTLPKVILVRRCNKSGRYVEWKAEGCLVYT